MTTASYSRPEPPAPVEGYVWQAAEAGPEWRLDAHGWLCRAGAGPGHSACGRPAVAALNRGRPNRQNWWRYCAEHLYGRWIEDSKVMEWRLTPVMDLDALDAMRAAARANGIEV